MVMPITIYIDLVIIINFIFDLFILKTVNGVLRRNVAFKRIILGGVVGEVSILFFLVDNLYVMLIMKILLAIVINIVTFGFHDYRYLINNLAYFYMTSIILGGFVFFLKINKINYMIIILLSPLFLLGDQMMKKNLRNKYQNYYDVLIVFKNKRMVRVRGYLDTGNKLVDPMTKRSILVLNKKVLKGVVQIRNPLYVGYNVVNSHSMMKCIVPSYVEVNNLKNERVLIGIMDNEIKLDGIDCLLSNQIMEGLHV